MSRVAAAAGADAVLIGTALSAARMPAATFVAELTRVVRRAAVKAKICGLTRPEDAAAAVGRRCGVSGRRFCWWPEA